KLKSVSTQVVAAAKLLVFNPNEFELWKMRIEQYFLMTDYALWEVILNGDSPLPTRTVDGVKIVVPPNTVEQKLARKNELKARGMETDIREKDKKSSKNRQNRARNGKVWKSQSQVKAKNSTKKKSKSTPTKVKVNDGAETEEKLYGPTRTHLMGRDSPLRFYFEDL
ncbi:hypothetical protein Tco_0351169, partial [Tanacetum coccineum]